MKRIVPFPRVRQLKDRETDSLISLIVQVVDKKTLLPETFAQLLEELTTCQKSLQKALFRQRKNELTAEIRRIDELRKKEYKTLLKGVDYYLSMSDTPLEEAALELWHIIKPYGTELYRENDRAETAQLRSLLKKLQRDEAVTAIETLNMRTLVDSLEALNEEFDILYLKRASAEAEDDTPKLIPVRKDIADLLDVFVDLINFYNHIEPAAYGPIAGELAEIIGDVMAIAKARKTRKTNEESTVVALAVTEAG